MRGWRRGAGDQTPRGPRTLSGVGVGLGPLRTDEHQGAAASFRPSQKPALASPRRPVCSVFCPHPIPGLTGYFCRVSMRIYF